MEESLSNLNPELVNAGTSGNYISIDPSTSVTWNPTPCYTYSGSWPKSKTIKFELSTTDSPDVILPKLASLLSYIQRELNWDIDNFKFRS